MFFCYVNSQEHKVLSHLKTAVSRPLIWAVIIWNFVVYSTTHFPRSKTWIKWHGTPLNWPPPPIQVWFSQRESVLTWVIGVTWGKAHGETLRLSSHDCFHSNANGVFRKRGRGYVPHCAIECKCWIGLLPPVGSPDWFHGVLRLCLFAPLVLKRRRLLGGFLLKFPS